MLELFNALEDLHKHNPKIINRNINPIDIMITNDEVVKVTNFNYAAISNGDNYNTSSLEMRNVYNAEELYRQIISEKADIYSLGMVLNFMITGKTVINNYEESSIGKVIKKAIDNDHNNRYSSIEEFRNVLIKKKVRHLIGLNNISKSSNLTKDNIISQINTVNNSLKEDSLNGTKLDDYEKHYEKYYGDNNDNLNKFGRLTKEEDKKTVNFPGFRTGIWWKRVISVLWVITILSMFIGTEGGIFKKIFSVLPHIIVVFFICNYNGVQNYFPLSKSDNKIERTIGVVVYSFIILGVLGSFMG